MHDIAKTAHAIGGTYPTPLCSHEYTRQMMFQRYSTTVASYIMLCVAHFANSILHSDHTLMYL